MKIFIVEDDQNIRELILYTLKHQGYEAEGFEKPSLFRQRLREEIPDLLILDLMLPEEDGITILKSLRGTHGFEKLPIILLTAKSSEFDKVVGLDAGADDYITKPFGMMELLARIKAVLRRSGKSEADNVLELGDLKIDKDRHEVRVKGESISLTSKEYEMLVYLMENRDLVISRETLLSKIWGYDFDGENRTVDVHIRTLRKKLGDASGLIKTVRGFGYKITQAD